MGVLSDLLSNLSIFPRSSPEPESPDVLTSIMRQLIAVRPRCQDGTINRDGPMFKTTSYPIFIDDVVFDFDFSFPSGYIGIAIDGINVASFHHGTMQWKKWSVDLEEYVHQAAVKLLTRALERASNEMQRQALEREKIKNAESDSIKKLEARFGKITSL